MDKVGVMNHWRYFLLLEKDFIVLQDYIEIVSDNYNVYSLQLSKLLQLSCAEFDSVLRILCDEVNNDCDFADHNQRNGKIGDYKKIIFNRFPGIESIEVSIPHIPTSIKPLEGWTNGTPPNWWNSYNLVKHYRHSQYKEATLINVINALSALMLANLYLYRIVSNEPCASPNPKPQYFNCKYFGFSLRSGNKELPSV